MKIIVIATLLGGVVHSLGAQQRDTVQARRDSIAKARADSIALVRELEAQQRDTATREIGPQQPTVNPRLLPDISVVGDLVGDFSPEGSTQEDVSRFGVREIELAVQAAVDPYFRGDVFLGFSDVEGVHVEQAFMTTTALPAVELRLGRFLMPFGKLNTTHRHDLHTVDYPWVIQSFLSPEGLGGTGLYASRIFAPFGFYQEILLTVVDRLGETPEDLFANEPPNREVEGMGFSARLRNYWDFSESSNLEVSASAITGRIEQPFDFGIVEPNAINVRRSIVGADITFRWRPLEQGLYKSFIAQAEFMRQFNERNNDPLFGGPNRDFDGLYAFARWQLTRRLYLSGRYDWVEEPINFGATLKSGSGYLEWYPSEFSKFILAYERLMPGTPVGLPRPDAFNRILVQATFALGPHKPHPF